MAGYKTKDDIWYFWDSNSELLSEVFPDLQGNIPSTATITRAQRMLESDVLGDELKSIMSRQYDLVRVSRKIYATEVLSRRDVLACDGQAMRATDRLQSDGSRSGGKQITSIVSYETGMTLGQAIHNKKNQEKKDIIELSKDLDISNTIMTWDAINTHTELVEFVVSKHADVFASIKSNQGLTYEGIVTAYEAYKKGARPYMKDGHNATATETVISGSNHYTRRIVTLRAEDCLSPDVLKKWPHIKTIAVIETASMNMTTGKVTNSVRYYITTLEMDFEKYPDFARDLLAISLKRWCVEVNHWHLDMFFDQDKAAYDDDDAAFYMGWPKAWAVFNLAKDVWADKAQTLEEFQMSTPYPVGKPNDAYAKYFIGKSYISDFNGQNGAPHNVTFEPGCRNNWHVHHDSVQVLVAVAGRGWYQEWGKEAVEMTPGTVIAIPVGVKHWHGAAKDSWFQHLTYMTKVGKDASNEWLEPVTDEVYGKLK